MLRQKEYISLIKHVQKTVLEKFNVALEREVKIIGEDLEKEIMSEGLSIRGSNP